MVVYVVCSYSYVGLSFTVQYVYVYVFILMHYSMQHGGTCRWSHIISFGIFGCPEHLPEERPKYLLMFSAAGVPVHRAAEWAAFCDVWRGAS